MVVSTVRGAVLRLESQSTECTSGARHSIAANRTAKGNRTRSRSASASSCCKPLFTMHGNKKMFGAGPASGQHGLHHDTMRCVIVSGYHYFGIGAQQARDSRRDLIESHGLLIDKYLVSLIDREGQRFVLR